MNGGNNIMKAKETMTEKFALISLIVMITIPVIISVYFQCWPNWNSVFRGVWPVALFLYPASIANTFIYIPIMGQDAAYLSFLTGNITNIKLPCYLNSVHSYTNTSSELKNTVATVAISASTIVTTLIIAIVSVALYPFIEYLSNESSIMYPGMSQVLPALFGTLGAIQFSKKPKESIAITLFLVFVLIIKGNIILSNLIIISVCFSIVISFFEYKKGKVNQQ